MRPGATALTRIDLRRTFAAQGAGQSPARPPWRPRNSPGRGSPPRADRLPMLTIAPPSRRISRPHLQQWKTPERLTSMTSRHSSRVIFAIGPVPEDARVVDEDVDPAPFRADAAHHGLDGARVAHVRGPGEHAPRAFRLEALGQCVGVAAGPAVVEVGVIEDHPRPGPMQGPRDGRADALRGPRDQGGLARQVDDNAHVDPPRIHARPGSASMPIHAQSISSPRSVSR